MQSCYGLWLFLLGRWTLSGNREHPAPRTQSLQVDDIIRPSGVPSAEKVSEPTVRVATATGSRS